MMKKLLLTGLIAVISLTVFSQNPTPEYALIEVRSSDDYEYETYSYNSDLLLEATDILWEDGTLLKDSLSYDASNNIIKLDKHQFLNGAWAHVAYIEYSYDENGNRLSRSNYNSGGTSTFNLGGVYNYHYEDGKRTSWELYMSGTDLVEKATLTYNEDGQIIEEIAQDIWNSGSMEDSWKITYEYNTDGTLKTSSQLFWDTMSWIDAGGEWFYYDDNNNCIKWEHKNGNTVTNRNLYEYNLDYTVDQLVLPVNPEAEADNESLVEMNNMVTINQWFTEDDMGVLTYVCDYIYTYELVDVLGVENQGSVSVNMSIFPNPTSEFLNIRSNNTVISDINIFDNTGKMVLNEINLNNKNTSLDVSTLESGVYFVRLFTSRGTITEKLVIQ